MIHCPTCNHDLLEMHGTVEDLDDKIMYWCCVECVDCLIEDEVLIPHL